MLAKQKDFAVPQNVYDRSMDYLKHIDAKFDEHVHARDASHDSRLCAVRPPPRGRHRHRRRRKNFSVRRRWTTWGRKPSAGCLRVLSGDPSMTPARTWLNNHATETANAAHFAFSYGDGNYLVLDSDRRADAIVLDALIADQPKSDLIP